MPDGKARQDVEHKGETHTPAVEKTNTGTPPDSPASPPAEGISESRMEGAIHAVEDRVKRAEWLMIGLTAGIVLLTLGLVIVGTLQWHVMSGQLDEMKSGSGDTHDLAVAAKSQAQAAETLARAATIQATAATAQLDSLRQSVELTRQSNALTRDSLYVTESADIQVDNIACMPAPLGANTGVIVTLRNTGRTTASGMTNATYLGGYGGGQIPTPVFNSVSSVGAGQAVDQGALPVNSVHGAVRGVPITTDEMVRLINEGGTALHVWGWVKYADKFLREHLTVFDSVYVPKSPCTFNVVKGVAREGAPREHH